MKPTDPTPPRDPRQAASGHAPHAHPSAPGGPSGHGTSPSFPYDEMHNDDVAHEHSDINVRAIVMSTVVVAVVCVVTAVLMYVLFWTVLETQAEARDPRLSPLARPATSMPPNTLGSPEFGAAPEPRLLTNEPVNLQQIREQERALLSGYGWVDQAAGVARISIDQAKKLVIQRGLPVRPDAVSDERFGTRLPAYGESSSGRIITRPVTAAPAPPAAAPAAEPAPAHKGGH
jgi:hypothetical protein